MIRATQAPPRPPIRISPPILSLARFCNYTTTKPYYISTASREYWSMYVCVPASTGMLQALAWPCSYLVSIPSGPSHADPYMHTLWYRGRGTLFGQLGGPECAVGSY